MVPAVNQIEVHPYFRQSELLAVDAEHGILSQAWSPIGGITFYRDGSHGSTLEDPTIGEIADAHGKTPAQVMLRWHLQQGRQAIPKSVTPARIAENFDVFDFELTADAAGRHRRPRHRRARRSGARAASPARTSASRSPRPESAQAGGLQAISSICWRSGLAGNRINSSHPAAVKPATASATLCCVVRAPATIRSTYSPTKL